MSVDWIGWLIGGALGFVCGFIVGGYWGFWEGAAIRPPPESVDTIVAEWPKRKP